MAPLETGRLARLRTGGGPAIGRIGTRRPMPTGPKTRADAWDHMGYHGTIWASMEPLLLGDAAVPPDRPRLSLTGGGLKEWLRNIGDRGRGPVLAAPAGGLAILARAYGQSASSRERAANPPSSRERAANPPSSRERAANPPSSR